MTSSAPAGRPEVFQCSLSLERHWVKEVLRAVLGAILFQRVLGNLRPSSVDVAGVTFPVPSDADVEALITAKVDAFSTALLSQTPQPHRLILALYPTPLSPRDPPPPKPRQPAVSTALGWFSASAKALGAGGEEEGGEVDDRDCGKVWEGWVIEVEVVGEGRRGGGEERLRSQLNDFLLRTVMFVNEKTTHVPPVTSAELLPFGVQILIDPVTPPFPIPKPVVQAPTAFPLLHKTLVSPARTGQAEARRLDGGGR